MTAELAALAQAIILLPFTLHPIVHAGASTVRRVTLNQMPIPLQATSIATIVIGKVVQTA